MTIPPTTARVFDDDDQRDTIEASVDDEIFQITDVDEDHEALLAAARGFFRLRHVLYLHMGDSSPWVDYRRSRREQLDQPREHPVDTTGAEVAELEQYIAHLSSARHGTCTFCNRWIFANEPLTHVHRDRAWHPRVWLRMLVDVVRHLAGVGHYQDAHPACAGDRACTESHYS